MDVTKNQETCQWITYYIVSHLKVGLEKVVKDGEVVEMKRLLLEPCSNLWKMGQIQKILYDFYNELFS